MSANARKLLIDRVSSRLNNDLPRKQVADITEILEEALDQYGLKVEHTAIYSVDNYIKAFTEAKRAFGIKESTLKFYERCINGLMTFCQVPVPNITGKKIRAYLDKRKIDGICDVTLNSERKVYSSFFGWLKDQNYINHNPADDLELEGLFTESGKIFSEAESERLFDGCKTTRDWLIVSLLKETGCRIRDLVSTDKKDADLVLGTIQIGDKRYVLSDDLKIRMTGYLKYRSDDCEALFVSMRKIRISVRGMQFVLEKLGERANVDKVCVQKFRRTFRKPN